MTASLRARLGSCRFGVTGEDAVEIGLRTALLATGRTGVVAFTGGYHGTGLLALAATGFERFREPFAAWLPGPVYRYPYGRDPGPLPQDAGAVLVEPVPGRAGAVVPPGGFLETLRRRCDDAGALLIADEIYCGLGRTGTMWSSRDLADILLAGKALGGGLPLSAALFRRPGLAELWDELGPRGRAYAHPPGEPARLRGRACRPRCRAGVARSRADRRRALRARRLARSGAPARDVRERGGLISATPPLVIELDLIDEALERLG